MFSDVVHVSGNSVKLLPASRANGDLREHPEGAADSLDMLSRIEDGRIGRCQPIRQHPLPNQHPQRFQLFFMAPHAKRTALRRSPNLRFAPAFAVSTRPTSAATTLRPRWARDWLR